MHASAMPADFAINFFKTDTFFVSIVYLNYFSIRILKMQLFEKYKIIIHIIAQAKYIEV